MSNIDKYLEQIFGKMNDREKTNIPGSVSILKLWLKLVGELFEYHDKGDATRKLDMETFSELITKAASDKNFIRNSVLSASNFTEDYDLGEGSIHPEWVVICATVEKNFLSNISGGRVMSDAGLRTLTDGTMEIKNIQDNATKMFASVLKDTSEDKYIKILKRFCMMFIRMFNGNIVDIDDTKRIFGKVIPPSKSGSGDGDGAGAGSGDGSGGKKKYNKMMGGSPLTEMKGLMAWYDDIKTIYIDAATDAAGRFGLLKREYDKLLANTALTIPLSIISSYNYTKVLSKILKSQPEKSNFFTEETTGRRFVRKTKGKLYEIKNGQEVEIDETYVKYGANLKNAGVSNEKGQFQKVTEYYDKCLSGDLKSQDGTCYQIDYVTAERDLDEIEVPTLLLIVKQFQIPTEDVIDQVSKSRVVRLKGYDEWLKVVEKTVQPAELTAIKKNASLRTYIEILVSYFNKHLELLNKGYKVQHDPGQFQTELSPLGLAKILYRGNKASMIQKYSHADLMYITQLAQANVENLQARTQINKVGGQNGGAVGNVELPDSLRPIAELLKTEMNLLIKSLEAKGKTILTKDHEDIKKRLDDLSVKETKMLDLYKYIVEYNDLLSLKGSESDSMLEISIDNLIKFNELYRNKLPKVIEKQLTLEINRINKSKSNQAGNGKLAKLLHIRNLFENTHTENDLRHALLKLSIACQIERSNFFYSFGNTKTYKNLLNTIKLTPYLECFAIKKVSSEPTTKLHLYRF